MVFQRYCEQGRGGRQFGYELCRVKAEAVRDLTILRGTTCYEVVIMHHKGLKKMLLQDAVCAGGGRDEPLLPFY